MNSDSLEYQIIPMTPADWDDVHLIYQQGIATGAATFETAPPASWEQWDHEHIRACSLVAKGPEILYGWAALSPVSRRRVYAGVAEASLYVREGYRGKGIGKALLVALITVSEQHGIWTLQALVFPENLASIRMNLACGFREVGIREKLGKMTFGPYAGSWRDVLLMERRRSLTGMD